ncbi:hypothetical protein NDU88_011311 [Pleurodeles waltl]|uniref:Uncharacterized protein n=1 Tax=Pleurodeles waltl TaxID=8319 RepID=A0AAV7QWV9_PLEWA|nr:hypothetical protein NDU88_011311 [Pleurodeles waltl]
MLADIRRSVAALAAPANDVPTQAVPIAQGVAPGASAVTEQGQAARAHPGAFQDLTTQTLVSVSQMLANLTVPVPTPPPTTPWASDPLQNSVLDLKRQVEALVAACNVPSLQVETSGPSVSQAPGPLSQTPPGGKEHVMLEKKPDIGLSMIFYAKKNVKSSPYVRWERLAGV